MATNPPKGTIIRPATPADLPELGRLGAMLVAEHHAFDPQRFLAPSRRTAASYASFLGTQLDEPNVLVLVAEDGGTTIGYVYGGVEDYDYMSLRGPAGIVYDIIVDPQHRGRGVGRTLLDALLERFKERGMTQVVLSTAEGNAAGQRLFEKAGFRRTMIEMTREL